MLNFFKKKKKTSADLRENLADYQNSFIDEHNYKMEHDPQYRKSFEQECAFIKADHEARENAGLANKAGSYTFTCPNCGSECRGDWINFEGSLHGHTDCFTCNIHIRV